MAWCWSVSGEAQGRRGGPTDWSHGRILAARFGPDGDRKIDMVNKKAGKTVGDGTIVVAEDGKTRTVTSTMTNAKGEKVTSKLAYDKS